MQRIGRRVVVARVGGKGGGGAPGGMRRVPRPRPASRAPAPRRRRARSAFRPHARHVLICQNVFTLQHKLIVSVVCPPGLNLNICSLTKFIYILFYLYMAQIDLRICQCVIYTEWIKFQRVQSSFSSLLYCYGLQTNSLKPGAIKHRYRIKYFL